MSGQKLREVRLKRKVSLKALAEKMGVSVPYLSLLESGRAYFSSKQELRYLANLGECEPK